jgi:hypothetical protein
MTAEFHITVQAAVELITRSALYLSSWIGEQGARQLVLLNVFPMVVGVIAINRA